MDGVRPTISSVSLVSSTGGSDGVYTAGETLTASVEFDEDVIVSGGPQLELDFEGTVKLADFSYADPKCEGPFCGFSPGPWAVRGIQLMFDYTVLSGDSDSDGAAVGANAVSLNGGAIKDAAGNDAELTHDAVPDDPGHKVSAVPPPPDNVRAVSQKRGAVKLTWKVPDNSRVTGYGIERRRVAVHGNDQQRSAGGPTDHHTLVEDTGSADTGYTDESAEKGVEYEYQVSARNEAGAGEGSDWVRAGPGTASNTPATGAPTISGTAQVGETLTAGITGIADADGLSGETFTYQWVSGDGTTDTDIEKATDSTYKLVDADQGRFVKVRVTFTDGGGNEETLTSAPTGPVWGDGPPEAPRNLTATAGNKEVTLSWESPEDNGNAPATGYRIEWRVDGKDYSGSQWGTARSTTYTTNDQANLANGVKYFFRVRAGNGRGYSQGPYGPTSGEVSATPTSGSAVDLGTPVLSDTKTLHHGMVRLDWQDVEDAGWYVVQYYHVKGGEWLDLPAAGVDIAFHGSSAVVSNLHGLSWLRVGAASCDGASEWSQIEELYGTEESDWEDVPVPEVAEGDEIEPCPVILGTPVLSDTKTLHHGMVRLDWEDIEDAGWYVVQYYHVKGGEWLDLPAEGVDIAFHGSSAVVSNLHGLSWLRVRAMSCVGASEWSQIEELYGTKASDWEGVPVPEVAEGDEIETCDENADTSDNSPATGAPAISGTAQVGETLEVDTSGISDADGLENAAFTYQWLADDVDISGATGYTYTLTDSELGKSVKIEVSFTDDEGNDESLSSAATDAVAAAEPSEPPAKPRGLEATATHGQVVLSWDDPGDDSITGYVILRRVRVNDQGGEFSVLVADTGTAATTYTDNTVAASTTYTYRIKAINRHGESERSRWYHIDTPAPPVPNRPTGLTATAAHDAITLTWDDPNDDSITGYVILRRNRDTDAKGEFTELTADTGSAATAYTDGSVAAETRYTYRIKAINEHGVSERSRWVHIDTSEPPVQTSPDLTVGSPSVTDSSPETGDSFTLSATVGNGGDGSSAATTLRYYRSTDLTITTSDTSVGTDGVGTLAASGSSSESIGLTAPSTAGTYYYGACVDAVSGESDTTNNCSTSVQVTVVMQETQPDLTVTLSITPPSGGIFHVGSAFGFGATVRNAGDGASTATTLRYYQSKDAPIRTPETEIGTDAVGALAAPGVSAESISLTAPSTAGTYYYNACVDAVAGESNTTNNCSFVSIGVTVVPEADLVVGSPSVTDSSPETGDSFTLSATVGNDGDGSSAATTLRYYRSTDSTITTSDTSVGTHGVGRLAASGSSSESIGLTAPSTAGTYYYGACVDAVSGESDTTNNCSTSVQVTVSEPPAGPDLNPYAIVVSTNPGGTGPGGNVGLSVGVRNDGDESSAATTVRFYQSTDATITTADTEVGTNSLGARSPGATDSIGATVSAPLTPGTYYYGACVDAVSGESDTSNNCSGSVRVVVS